METAFEEYWKTFLAQAPNPESPTLIALREVARHAFAAGWDGGDNAGFARGYLTKKMDIPLNS